MLPKFNIELYAWNRTKDDTSDGEFTKQDVDYQGNPKIRASSPPLHASSFTQMLARANRYPHAVSKSVTNQQIGCFTADVSGWDQQCYRARVDSSKQEVGIGMRVHGKHVYSNDVMYLAMIDFDPGLCADNRHIRAFWKDIGERYAGRKLYLFDSGNAHHALLDTIHDERAHAEWMETLSRHEEVVDQKWIKFANAHPHGGVIRVTSGKTRPQPKLWKWVNL